MKPRTSWEIPRYRGEMGGDGGTLQPKKNVSGRSMESMGNWPSDFVVAGFFSEILCFFLFLIHGPRQVMSVVF